MHLGVEETRGCRGMCSGTAKQAIFDRFSTSGKERLILLIASDLDPAGDHIAQNFVNYMIRDAGLDEEEVDGAKDRLDRWSRSARSAYRSRSSE